MESASSGMGKSNVPVVNLRHIADDQMRQTLVTNKSYNRTNQVVFDVARFRTGSIFGPYFPVFGRVHRSNRRLEHPFGRTVMVERVGLIGIRRFRRLTCTSLRVGVQSE